MTQPTIHKTKSGKKYFIVHGRKIIINSKLTKREILQIYKLLLKNVKKQKQSRSRRRSKKQKSKTFKSTIDEANRVSSSSGPAKDSGDKDLINKLINDANTRKEEDRKKPEALPAPPAPLLVDYLMTEED